METNTLMLEAEVSRSSYHNQKMYGIDQKNKECEIRNLNINNLHCLILAAICLFISKINPFIDHVLTIDENFSFGLINLLSFNLPQMKSPLTYPPPQKKKKQMNPLGCLVML